MKLTWYAGNEERRAKKAGEEIPRMDWGKATAPEGYDADEGLAAAVNVALYLEQPLLLTGEPGTGKTQLANSLAWELGLELHEFATKSTSASKDLFYAYDAVGHLGSKERKEAKDFIEPQALGKAILRSLPPDKLPDGIPLELRGEAPPTRSIVLIDEIDKAPRDFPNDLLYEIERMKFRIPELTGKWIGDEEAPRPIVVITSNSEKQLPAAFLRRCTYYHIPFPDEARLRNIVTQRLTGLVDLEPKRLQRALNLFYSLRARGAGIDKKPSTSEFLVWLRILERAEGDPFADWETIEPHLSPLLKTERDRRTAEGVVDEWLKNPDKPPQSA